MAKQNTSTETTDCQCRGKCSDCRRRGWFWGGIIAVGIALGGYLLWRFRFRN